MGGGNDGAYLDIGERRVFRGGAELSRRRQEFITARDAKMQRRVEQRDNELEAERSAGANEC